MSYCCSSEGNLSFLFFLAALKIFFFLVCVDFQQLFNDMLRSEFFVFFFLVFMLLLKFEKFLATIFSNTGSSFSCCFFF